MLFVEAEQAEGRLELMRQSEFCFEHSHCGYIWADRSVSWEFIHVICRLQVAEFHGLV